MSKDRPPICKRTSSAREEAGFTQKEIAAALGIEDKAYNKYETRSAIRQDLIVTFCRLCNVNEKWLLDNVGPKHPIDTEGEDDIRQDIAALRGKIIGKKLANQILDTFEAAIEEREK